MYVLYFFLLDVIPIYSLIILDNTHNPSLFFKVFYSNKIDFFKFDFLKKMLIAPFYYFGKNDKNIKRYNNNENI